MILPIVYGPDPSLNEKCLEVPLPLEPETKSLIQDMFETMYAEGGIGLAAPQVGKNLRIFVCDPGWAEKGHPHKPLVFINPVMTEKSKKLVGYKEGCLSFPEQMATTTRHKKVSLYARDENGKPFTVHADGILSAVVQHEFDHLEGKTIL